MSKIYSKKMIMSFAQEIKVAYKQFNVKTFENTVFDKNWDTYSDLVKITNIATTLNDMIDKPYLEQLGIFLRVSDKAEYRWINLILPKFVSIYGLDHFDESMYALKEFTKKCTSEFGIRPFVNKYPEESAFLMYMWAGDQHFRVRRLASEGSRPYLPSSTSIRYFIENPLPIIPILDRLKQDKEMYVKKSVSNSMNDISKQHPDLVLKMCREWKKLNDENTNFIIQRAMRTLLKQGNKEALELIQADYQGPIKIHDLQIKQDIIRIGDKIDFSFKIEDTDFNKNNKNKCNQMEVEDEQTIDQEEIITQKGQINKKKNKKDQQMEAEKSNNISSLIKGFKIEFRIDFLNLTEEYESKIFLLEENHIMRSKIESFQASVSTNDYSKKIHIGDNYISILINGIQQYKTHYHLYKKK